MSPALHAGLVALGIYLVMVFSCFAAADMLRQKYPKPPKVRAMEPPGVLSRLDRLDGLK